MCGKSGHVACVAGFFDDIDELQSSRSCWMGNTLTCKGEEGSAEPVLAFGVDVNKNAI